MHHVLCSVDEEEMLKNADRKLLGMKIIFTTNSLKPISTPAKNILHVRTIFFDQVRRREFSGLSTDEYNEIGAYLVRKGEIKNQHDLDQYARCFRDFLIVPDQVMVSVEGKRNILKIRVEAAG